MEIKIPIEDLRLLTIGEIKKLTEDAQNEI